MTSRSRRAMGDSSALIARRTQASRDALRRRQKEKRARIVKRHVRYKHKQKLLSQLQLSEREEPIVAPELSRFDDEEDVHAEQAPNAVNANADPEPSAPEKRVDVVEQHETSSEEEHRNESDAMANTHAPTNRVRSKQKYVPFAKERMQFQEMKEQQEREQQEREHRIKQREAMLKSSKRRRNKQAKQYRAVTHRGQPKMKHRVDALLARIEKQ